MKIRLSEEGRGVQLDLFMHHHVFENSVELNTDQPQVVILVRSSLYESDSRVEGSVVGNLEYADVIRITGQTDVLPGVDGFPLVVGV